MRFKSVIEEQMVLAHLAMATLALDIVCESRHSMTLTPAFRKAACEERDRVVALLSDLKEAQRCRLSAQKETPNV